MKYRKLERSGKVSHTKILRRLKLALSSPEDLMDVALVAHRIRMRRELVHWTLSNGTRQFTLERPPTIVADDPIIVEALVCKGLGIGLLSDVVGVATGRLVPVL